MSGMSSGHHTLVPLMHVLNVTPGCMGPASPLRMQQALSSIACARSCVAVATVYTDWHRQTLPLLELPH